MTAFLRLIIPFVFLVFSTVLWSNQSPISPRADAVSSANAAYQQGFSALQKGDLASARTRFEEVVKLAPQSPEGHNSLAWAQGEIEPAILHFQNAVKLKPDFALARMNLSNALVRKGDISGALRETREAVRLAPGDSETHHTLGRILDASGNLDEATAELRKSIELEPQRAEGRAILPLS